MAPSPVCWSGRDAETITAHEWGVVVAARRIADRPLEHRELQRLLGAERAVEP